MVKHYIIRDNLYKEELFLEKGISQQVCIDVYHYNNPTNLYSTHREGKLLVQDEMAFKDVSLISYSKLIIYVKNEELALNLAKRWCNEEAQKAKGYEVYGIDKYYSVFG